jgi:hypothetical protein
MGIYRSSNRIVRGIRHDECRRKTFVGSSILQRLYPSPQSSPLRWEKADNRTAHFNVATYRPNWVASPLRKRRAVGEELEIATE